MKKMNAPSNAIPYIKRHKDVVDSKANTVNRQPNSIKSNLLLLEQDIGKRYVAFEQHINRGNLFNFPEDTSFAAHSDDLLSCYKGLTKKVKVIFSIIENAQPANFLKRCPYCGITLPKTHDHYLPESKFPELAVHALNLIPCCFTCNQTKNDIWKNQTHRVFIHFYMDNIPRDQFLHVNLTSSANMNAVGATFTLSRPPNIPNNVWDVLNAHYDKLGLIQQYNDQANNEISTVFNACVSHLKNGGVWVDKFIRTLLLSDEQLYGENHWRVVLMKALANNAVFINAVRSA